MDAMYSSMISERIWNILQTEAPIRLEVLARRTASSFGINRVTDKIIERVLYFCKRDKHTYTTYEGRIFYWNGDQDPSDYYKFRVGSSETVKRTAEDIPLEEAVNAVVYLVDSQVAVPPENIPSGALNLMGYTRMTESFEKLFTDALNAAIVQGRLAKGIGEKIVKG